MPVIKGSLHVLLLPCLCPAERMKVYVAFFYFVYMESVGETSLFVLRWHFWVSKMPVI